VKPPLVIFVYDDEQKARKGRLYQREAAVAGFSVIVTCWQNIEPSEAGASIRQGWEVGATNGEESPILAQHVVPELLFHRKLISGHSEEMLERLVRYTGCLCSYHPGWKPIGQKWIQECCFLTSDSAGLVVPRPRTYLFPKDRIQESLAFVGHRKALIFKPSAASLCEGILLSSPSDFSVVTQMVRRTRWPQYVVQEIVPDTVLYNGRRFDLRIYALVTCFRPLQLMVPREGVVRIAAKPYDQRAPADSLSVLTGSTNRSRLLGWADNISVTDLLNHLTSEGLDVGNFWTNVDSLLRSAFGALADYPPLLAARDLEGRFYLAGVDLLMVKRDDSYSLLFLETNYTPDLARWGPTVDPQLRFGHQQWLSHLAQLVSVRRTPKKIDVI